MFKVIVVCACTLVSGCASRGDYNYFVQSTKSDAATLNLHNRSGGTLGVNNFIDADHCAGPVSVIMVEYGPAVYDTRLLLEPNKLYTFLFRWTSNAGTAGGTSYRIVKPVSFYAQPNKRYDLTFLLPNKQASNELKYGIEMTEDDYNRKMPVSSFKMRSAAFKWDWEFCKDDYVFPSALSR